MINITVVFGVWILENLERVNGSHGYSNFVEMTHSAQSVVFVQCHFILFSKYNGFEGGGCIIYTPSIDFYVKSVMSPK